MTIYIDVIFLENLIINSIIIITCFILKNKKIKIKRILLASSIGSSYVILEYFINFNDWEKFLNKVIISIIMNKVSFDSKGKKLIKDIILFYFVSIVYGGMAFFLIYNLNLSKVSLYEDNFIINNLEKVLICSMILGGLLIYSIKQILIYKMKDTLCEIEIFYSNQSVKLRAFIDTGNLLKEPISNYDVIIVEQKIIEKIMDENMKQILNLIKKKNSISNCLDYELKNIRIIPYKSLGNENGILYGFVPDYVKVYIDEIRIFKNVVIGIYESKFTKNNLYNGLIGFELINKGDCDNEFYSNNRNKNKKVI